MEKKLLRISEAATITGIGRTMAYEFVATGVWPSVKIGRALRIPAASLQVWITEREEEARQRADNLRQGRAF